MKRNVSVLAVAAGLLMPAASAGAQQSAPTDVFPFPVHEKTLDNGLRIVSVPYDSPGLIAFYLVVRTGSRDEVEPGHSGFAHFFEHMMFRGTERYSPEEYNQILKRLGADSNAYTNDDRTVYHITAPASGFEKLVELEADRFRNLKYTEDAFRTEALAVLGEYNKSASNPLWPLEERLRDLAFTRHTYKHTTIGFLRDIKAMPGYYDYSLDFFNRFYRPDNVIAVVVGDITAERVNEVIARHFGEWKPGYQPPKIEAEPPQRERRAGHIEWPNPTRPYVMLGYHTPAFTTKTVEFPALDVISELLFSEAAPLYQELVVEQQIADFIEGAAIDHRDPYLFAVLARVKSEDAVQKVVSALRTHMDKLKAEPVTEDRLRRVTAHLRNQFTQSLDTPDAVAERLAHYLSLTGSVSTINELFRRYAEVTPADIQRIARQTFRPENETLVTLTRGKAPEVKR